MGKKCEIAVKRIRNGQGKIQEAALYIKEKKNLIGGTKFLQTTILVIYACVGTI